jgi:predicted nucleic acid-binding protein
MTALFADTYYWVALADFADSAHQRALILTSERAASRIVTTDEVLTEYLTFFSSAPESLRREAAESVEGLLASSVVRVIPQSRQSFLAGLRLYRARPDKGYSLVDCISMQTMRNEGLTEVFSPTTGILSRKVSWRCFVIRKEQCVERGWSY